MKDLLKKLRGDLAKHHNDYKALYESLEARRAKSETVDDTELSKLANMGDAGVKLREEFDRVKNEVEIAELVNEPAGEARGKDSGQQMIQRKSAGQQFIESEKFTGRKASEYEVGSVEVKELYGGGTAGNVPTAVDYQPGVIALNQRPLTIRDLVNVSETNAQSIIYFRQLARVLNAAPVAVRNGGNADFATKPESNLTFETKTATVRTLAHWVRAHRNILEDAPRLRDTIDNELYYGLDIVEEAQMISGDGTGENFEGFLTATGVQSRTHKTAGRNFAAGDKIADTLRKAITDIHLAFYFRDVAMVLSPTDLENLELEKDTQGRYLNTFDPVTQKLWRTPVAESPALPAGTGLVGCFKLAATLWDRKEAEIRVSEHTNDDFIKNAVRILAEKREAFGIVRADAVEKVLALNT